jgi:AcrR family transcriptional regulator
VPNPQKQRPNDESSTSARQRGRPAGFRRDDVIAELTRLFWTHGFDATGHAEIRANTGLSGSSLTHAFGSKLDLFDTALGHYLELVTPWTRSLEDAPDGLMALRNYLDILERHVDGDGTPAGCLIVNTAAGAVANQPSVAAHVRAYRDAWLNAFAAAVRRATTAGQLREGSPEARAQILYAVHVAVMLTAVAEPTREQARNLLQSARTLLDDWST